MLGWPLWNWLSCLPYNITCEKWWRWNVEPKKPLIVLLSRENAVKPALSSPGLLTSPIWSYIGKFLFSLQPAFLSLLLTDNETLHFLCFMLPQLQGFQSVCIAWYTAFWMLRYWERIGFAGHCSNRMPGLFFPVVAGGQVLIWREFTGVKKAFCLKASYLLLQRF